MKKLIYSEIFAAVRLYKIFAVRLYIELLLPVAVWDGQCIAYKTDSALRIRRTVHALSLHYVTAFVDLDNRH